MMAPRMAPRSSLDKPSLVFSRTLPTNPSQATTSTDPSKTLRPSDVADEVHPAPDPAAAFSSWCAAWV